MTAIKPTLIEPKDKWFRYVGVCLNGEDASSTGMKLDPNHSRSIPTKLLLMPGFVQSEDQERRLVRGFCNQNNIGGEVFVMDNDTVMQQLVLDRSGPHEQQVTTHLYVYSHGRATILKYDAAQMMSETHNLREGTFSYTSLNGAGNVLISYRLSVSEDDGDFVLTPTWIKGHRGKVDTRTPNVAKFLTKIKERLIAIDSCRVAVRGHDEFTHVADLVFGDKFDKLSKLDWIPYQVCHAFLKMVRFMDDCEEEQEFITGAESKTLQLILQECRDVVQKWYYHLDNGQAMDDSEIQPSANTSRFISMMANARMLRKGSASACVSLAELNPGVYMRECITVKVSPGRQTGKTNWAQDLVRNTKTNEAIVLLLPDMSKELQQHSIDPLRIVTPLSVFMSGKFGFLQSFKDHQGPVTVIVDDASFLTPSRVHELEQLVYTKLIQTSVDQRHEFEIILLG